MEETVKEYTLDISKLEEDVDVHLALVDLLGEIRKDLSQLVVCGFDGRMAARTKGATMGFVASELTCTGEEDEQLFIRSDHVLPYSMDYKESPSISVYNKNILRVEIEGVTVSINEPSDLLAIIRIIDRGT